MPIEELLRKGDFTEVLEQMHEIGNVCSNACTYDLAATFNAYVTCVAYYVSKRKESVR